jgi:hypothetical protein
MDKKRLKVPRTEAINKIEKQLEKAGILLAEAKLISRDNFEVKFKHWVDFAIEALKEIFESSSFAYEFSEHRSSEITYVSSSWIPDVEYYVSKQIIPKIEYLKILKENIPNFEERVVEQQVQSSLNPWPVVRGFLLRLSSYEVPEIIDRAGLTVHWNLNAKENFSNKMRIAAYRPRIDAAYLSLPSDDDRLRVAFIVARELATRATTNELNDALREIGWELCSDRLTPSDGSVRQLFFPERSQHDAYVEIRAILQNGVKSAVIVCSSEVTLSGVNGNVIMSGHGKHHSPDDERTKTSRSHPESF